MIMYSKVYLENYVKLKRMGWDRGRQEYLEELHFNLLRLFKKEMGYRQMELLVLLHGQNLIMTQKN